jgi:hypothetical protein
MEKLIFKYNVSDGYSYGVDTHIPFEYESRSAAEWDIMATAFQTFTDDDLLYHDSGESYLKLFGENFCAWDFFNFKPTNKSGGASEVDYNPKFEILTVDEFFERKEELFS